MSLFAGKPKICPACGHPATKADPLVKVDDGGRVHRTHTTDPRSGFYGAQARG
jgi:hypothetical protein